ncbi:RNaseH domain-containing protein [Streptomyces bauhiniae]|uniref:RNaseH domain-containing protein n=1 Tax=Streptomyces bauhiniae TaxID=2340725 RepID=UPI00365EF7A7
MAKLTTIYTSSLLLNDAVLAGQYAYVWSFHDWSDFGGEGRKDKPEILVEWHKYGAWAAESRKNKHLPEGADVEMLWPRSIATTALQALAEGYVHLDKHFRYMISLKEIDPAKLAKLFTYLEAAVKGMPLDSASGSGKSPLPDLVRATTPAKLALADVILNRGSLAPNPPDWAYQAVRWCMADKFAGTAFTEYAMKPVTPQSKESEQAEDEREPEETAKPRQAGWAKDTETAVTLAYRPLSDGSVIAWDHPFGPAFAHIGHPPSVEATQQIADNWPHLHEDWSARDYTLSRVNTKMATFTGYTNPVVHFHGSNRRVSNAVIYAKTAMVDCGGDKPVLSLRLDGPGGLKSANRYGLEIAARLDVDHTGLLAVQNRANSEIDKRGSGKSLTMEAPGKVRPLHATTPKSNGVGTGTGTHHHRLIMEHLHASFAQELSGNGESDSGSGAVPVMTLVSDSKGFGKRYFQDTSQLQWAQGTTSDDESGKKAPARFQDKVGLPSPKSIQRSIGMQGESKLVYLGLWYRYPTRRRMVQAIACAYGIDPETIKPSLSEVELRPGIRLVLHKADELLQHGTGRADIRRAEVNAIINRYQEPGTRLVVWCETEMPRSDQDGASTPANGSRTARRRAEETEKNGKDAKHAVRGLFAEARVPSQFTIGARLQYRKGAAAPVLTEIQPQKKEYHKDHAAFAAVLDMHRSLGVVDDRYEAILHPDKNPLPRIAYCGLHCRMQTKSNLYRGEPLWITTAAALIPPIKPGGVWTMLGWSNITNTWAPYYDANTAFHAKNYPLHNEKDASKTRMDRWCEVGSDAARALVQLQQRPEMAGLDLAVMLDGHAWRRIYPGFHNRSFGLTPDSLPEDDRRLWTPHQDITDKRLHPISYIRINTMQDELPRFVYAEKETTAKNRLAKGLDPFIKVSQYLAWPGHQPEGHPWFLFSESRTHNRSRLGDDRTRWRASDERDTRGDSELNGNWHSITTREINPMFTRRHSREDLAQAAARLSHQALAWSERTRYPAPLHAALQMDLDHPQYRRSAPSDKEADQEQRDILESAIGAR